MFLTTTFLQKCIENYNNNKKSRENYGIIEGINNTLSVLADTLILLFCILFFVLEFLMMIYSVIIAIRCTSKGPERITHIVLAVTFTLPYMLFNVTFNKCAVNVLKSSTEILPTMPNIMDKNIIF